MFNKESPDTPSPAPVLIDLPKCNGTKGQGEGKKKLQDPAHAAPAESPGAAPQWERDGAGGGPGEAAIPPPHSSLANEINSAVSLPGFRSRPRAWPREAPWSLCCRNFAAFSSARQMQVGIGTLPGERQLLPLRALAGGIPPCRGCSAH